MGGRVMASKENSWQPFPIALEHNLGGGKRKEWQHNALTLVADNGSL